MSRQRDRTNRRTVLKAFGATAIGLGAVSSAASATAGEGDRSARLELVGHTTLGARDGANTHGAVSEAHDLAAVGSFIAVDPELRIIDISDPANPEMTATIETGPGGDIRNSDIHPSEPWVFTANEGSVDEDGEGAGWSIVDASDKHDPELVSHNTIEGATSGVHNVQAFKDEYLITAGHGLGIVVFDITDPTEPERLSVYPAGEDGAHAAHVQGDYAYIASRDTGLEILDLSDPENPELAAAFLYEEHQDETEMHLGHAHHAVPHPSRDIVLLGEEIGTGEPGYKHIIEYDLEDGETELLSSFQFPQHATQTSETVFWWTGHFSDWGVGDQEDVLFSGDYKAGVQVFDCSDPEDPVRIDQYMPTEGVGEVRREDPERLGLVDNVPFTWGAESSLAGDSGRVYVSDATTGFYVFEFEGY
ncbi:LVIVD repeat-containing protein [Halosolutus amylolyticus]|uniref:LVIVD repeat-containing protein n=1 Tax=Halosolutus amylolyticus TaxID=2932267 RepID=A0ABD5PV79_9EURY|nr:hypothetical protein [Halosolutus amylolyticus]